MNNGYFHLSHFLSLALEDKEEYKESSVLRTTSDRQACKLTATVGWQVL